MSDNKKPRICEVLGVEVGEEWRVRGGRYTYRINSSGIREVKEDDGTWSETSSEYLLIGLINRPERIIHKSRWTPEDIEDAKAPVRLFKTAKICRGADTGRIYLVDDCERPTGESFLSEGVFPSLKPGETVSLDDILEAENDV